MAAKGVERAGHAGSVLLLCNLLEDVEDDDWLRQHNKARLQKRRRLDEYRSLHFGLFCSVTVRVSPSVGADDSAVNAGQRFERRISVQRATLKMSSSGTVLGIFHRSFGLTDAPLRF